jgi:hypothetical protein
VRDARCGERWRTTVRPFCFQHSSDMRACDKPILALVDKYPSAMAAVLLVAEEACIRQSHERADSESAADSVKSILSKHT